MNQMKKYRNSGYQVLLLENWGDLNLADRILNRYFDSNSILAAEDLVSDKSKL